jgi:hypothetical protein
MRISKVKIHNKKFSLFFPTLLTTPPRMVYFSSSIDTPSRNTKMIKSALVTLVASLTLATNANAQNTIRDIAFQSGMYQQQVIGTWAAYQAITGIDPSPMNPNSWYVPSGGGVLNVGYLNELERLRQIPSGAVVVQPTPYGGGGCFPGGGGGFNNTGWGVGVNAGVGGNFGGGYGGGRNYDYNNTNWGIGVNGGVGGNSGSWGGGGFDNLGWGVGINGGIGGNSGSFRSW